MILMMRIKLKLAIISIFTKSGIMKKGSKGIKQVLGLKFGRLTVLSFSHYDKRRSYWNCICECGNTCVVKKRYLQECAKASCGCWPRKSVSSFCGIRSLEEAKAHKMNCIMDLSHWENDCLIWDGYYEGKRPKTSFLNVAYLVKRLLWIFNKGEIPSKRTVINTYNNHKCININHLKLGYHNGKRKKNKKLRHV